MIPASIPSPPIHGFPLGPFTIHIYALTMILAMLAGGWITYVRYVRRGGSGDVALDAMFWAIPMGLVGARIYHVFTHPGDYFGEGKDPLAVFKVWEGGMAIFGAIGFGALGAVIALRIAKQRIGPFADSVAPALLVAQAIGRLGNYFNQELFGGSTELPWGLEIGDPYLQAFGIAPGTLVQPLFLYEIVWNLAMALLLVFLDDHIRFKSGQVMALYLVMYGTGRTILETWRLDTPDRILGLRVNMFTSLLVILLGIIVFFVARAVDAPTTVSPAEVEKYLEKREPQEDPEPGPNRAAIPASQRARADNRASEPQDMGEPDQKR